MFKYVSCVSGSLNDLKEAYKKKSNVTLVFHAARVLISILAQHFGMLGMVTCTCGICLAGG